MGRKAKDFSGMKIGHVLILGRAENRPNDKRVFWKCQCECGNIFETATPSLENKKYPDQFSCGCIKKHIPQKLGTRGEDLTGKRFGYLTVLERDYNHAKDLGLLKNELFWKCQCDCGNITYKRAYSLKNGHTLSCGCFNNSGEDLTGQKIGHTTVLGPDFEMSKNNTGCYWRCQCDCGNIFSITTNKLLTVYKDPRCPECMKIQGENLIGRTFGYLTVIAKDFEYKNNNQIKDGSYWKCRCICGKETTVRADCLRKGTIKSCGCKRRELSRKNNIIDETGNKYGKLTVIEIDENYVKDKGIKNSGNVTYWKCQCECGEICSKAGVELRSGKAIQCPKCAGSRGEFKIQTILENCNLSFVHDIPYFTDLKYNEHILRYDFIIFNEMKKPIRLIEYDGEQHFKPIPHFGGEKRYSVQQERDTIKNQYAADHNIPLVRIPYTVTNPTYSDIMGDTYLVNPIEHLN